MMRMAALLREHADELGQLSVLDSGTPVASAYLEYRMAADFLEYNAGWVDKLWGEVVPTWRSPAFDYALQEPYGVIGLIVPWNGAVAVMGISGGPALAAGNCLVVKAPEITPFA